MSLNLFISHRDTLLLSDLGWAPLYDLALVEAVMLMQRAAVDIGQESALAQTVEMVAPVAGDRLGDMGAKLFEVEDLGQFLREGPGGRHDRVLELQPGDID